MERRQRSSSIRSRILRSTVAIVLVPLAVLGAVVLASLQRLSSEADSSVAESRSALSEQVVTANLESTARNVADDLDAYLLERVKDAQVWASDPLIATASATARGEAARLRLPGRSIEELEARYAETLSLGTSPEAGDYLARQIEASGAFAEAFFTDPNGYNVAYSAPTSDFVQSDEDWWKAAWEKGLDVGAIAFDESSGTFSSEISVRIDSATGERLGVLKAVLDLGVVQQIADKQAQNREVTILNEQGLILAETATGHVEDRIMDPGIVYADTVDPAIGEAVRNTGANGTGSVITDEQAMGAALTGRTQAPIGDFAGFTWTVVVDQPTEVAFAPIASVGQVRRSIDDASKTLTILIIVVLLVVALAAFVVARSLAGRIVRPILRLRDAADDVATTRLPELVDSIDRLQPGEDLPALEPISVPSGDEVEELSDKFNSVIDTATRLAAEQVESRRRNVSTAFVSMGRRNQSLIGRQLKVLDDLEKDETDPDLLKGLFSLDQLATRMRRNAESLLVLAGLEPTRTWSRPMSLYDVLRAAVGEIEDFSRIELGQIDEAHIPGNLVAEVAHLVAELCENATAYSPPNSTVRVNGQRREDGYRISIIDDGIGMTEAQLADANQKLRNPAGFDRAPSQYLGHFVVGRLAARLGIDVRLFERAEKGLVARVTLPTSMLVVETVPEPMQFPPRTPEPPAAATPAPVPPLRARPTRVAGTRSPAPAQSPAPAPTPAPAPAPTPAPAPAPAPASASASPSPAAPPTTRPPLSRRPTVRPSPAPTDAPASAAAPSPAPAPAQADAPVAGGTAPASAAPGVELTASGFRRRQRKSPTGPARARPAPADTPPARSAEEARNTLSSFMTGVGQGRRDAGVGDTTEDPPAQEEDQP